MLRCSQHRSNGHCQNAKHDFTFILRTNLRIAGEPSAEIEVPLGADAAASDIVAA